MKKLQVVIDTNVFFAALRSPHGASFLLLQLVDKGLFEVNLSVPLVFEYEDVAKRNLVDLPVNEQDVEDVLDYLCRISNARELFFDWRPVLKDPGDEMVLQLAAAGCDVIITFNKRDFEGSERFGVRVLTPAELLVEIGAIQ